MKKKYELNKEMHLDSCMKISAIDENDRTVTAVISSSAVDRDREVLLPKGMDAEKFAKNPVVLFAHDSHSPPIGKALWVKVKGKLITAKVQFANTDFASEIWELFKGKFLNAFSVGFIPHDGHSPTPKEIAKNPELANARFIIDKWELLEFSAVPVPANPEALMQAVKSKSLNLSDSTKELFQESLSKDDFAEAIDIEIEEDYGILNEFAATLGLGPLYVSTGPKHVDCPECGRPNAYYREIHPDTSINEIVLYCPDCKYTSEGKSIKELKAAADKCKIKLEPIPEYKLEPYVKLEPIPVDVKAVVLEEIKTRKGIMYD